MPSRGAAADDAAPFSLADLLPLARRIQPQTPVIVLVERAKLLDAVADVVRMMRAGARGVVDEADTPTLIELVQQELENRRPHSASPAPVPPADEITARKRAEQELLLANRRWRGILSAIPDLIFHVRSDGTAIDFHGASNDLLMPVDRILGINIIDFLDSSYVRLFVLPESAEAFRMAFAHRQPAVVEYTTPNEQSYEARLFPIEESDECIVVVRNVSERRRMEAALRSSEERYRSLVESTDSSIALFDASGQVLYANAIAARALGLTPESMIGRTQWELFPREAADYQMESIRRVIATGEGVVHESRTILKGEERWSRTSVQPVRDAAGQATAALINVTDITALRASEERYRIAAELMSDYAYSYRVEEDGDLVHEWVTPSYTRITGYEVGEVDFRGRYSLYVPEDQARAAADVQSTLLSRTTTSGEYQFITRQGERRWLQISRRPVLDDTGQRVVRMAGAPRTSPNASGRKRRCTRRSHAGRARSGADCGTGRRAQSAAHGHRYRAGLYLRQGPAAPHAAQQCRPCAIAGRAWGRGPARQDG
ncbi:MAG: PAS domain S-box protein [Chloroflexi bacterium]|nr:PAS domain S-box protein [Chloroflexota bacterium]